MIGSRAFLATVVVASVATAALTGCTFSPAANQGQSSSSTNADQQSVHGWVGTTQSAALFMQWTRNGSNVSGSLVDTEIDSSNSSKTKNYNESFTGTVSGNSVTLTFSGGFGTSSNLSGMLQDSKIILSFPQSNGSIQTITMSDGTIEQYNQDVSKLTGQAQSNAQATAKASADAAYNQRVSKERQAAAAELAAIEQDDYFKNDLTAMGTDLAKVSADLQKTQSEAADGQGSYCENVYTVYNDAVGAVYSDMEASVYTDAITVKNRADKIRAEISSLQSDLQALTNDGAGADAPSDAQKVIDGVNSDMGNAIATSNQNIDTGNGYVATAYSVGNGIATGACANHGPGKAPKPLDHIG